MTNHQVTFLSLPWTSPFFHKHVKDLPCRKVMERCLNMGCMRRTDTAFGGPNWGVRIYTPKGLFLSSDGSGSASFDEWQPFLINLALTEWLTMVFPFKFSLEGSSLTMYTSSFLLFRKHLSNLSLFDNRGILYKIFSSENFHWSVSFGSICISFSLFLEFYTVFHLFLSFHHLIEYVSLIFFEYVSNRSCWLSRTRTLILFSYAFTNRHSP